VPPAPGPRGGRRPALLPDPHPLRHPGLFPLHGPAAELGAAPAAGPIKIGTGNLFGAPAVGRPVVGCPLLALPAGACTRLAPFSGGTDPCRRHRYPSRSLPC